MATYTNLCVANLFRHSRSCKVVNRVMQICSLQNQSSRGLQTSAVLYKVTAGKLRRDKGRKPVMYEEINPPYQIGVRKGWTALNTSNLEGEEGKADRILEDLFIRRFLYGTFHNLILSEVIIKRRANQIILACMMASHQSSQRYYFLIGYTEELLSYWFKCPVKMEVQIVQDKPIYKWI